MTRLYYTIILIVGFLLNAISQPNNFSHYSIDEGLSQSVINCILQDQKGFLWIGTQNGLCRFNGEIFDVYSHNPGDSTSISNNWIYSIDEDINGNLWIGTKGGLNRYNQQSEQFTSINYTSNYPVDVTQYCYDVKCTNDGKVLINTPPVITIFDPELNKFKNATSKLKYDGAVKDVNIPMLLDENEQVWVGTTTGLYLFNMKNGRFKYFDFKNSNNNIIENISVTSLYKSHDETIWAGTSQGLFRYNPDIGKFTSVKIYTYDRESTPFENICIRSIIEDQNHQLYIGTEGNGLYSVSLTHPAELVNYTSANSRLGHNIVQSLLIDHSQNLWIGTLNGISKTDLKKEKFKLYRNSNSPGSVDLSGNVIASLFKNDDGILWIGTWGQGLNFLNRITNKVEHFSTQHIGNHHINNDFVHVVFKDHQKHIWIGTRDGILIYSQPENRFIPYREYFNNSALPDLSNIRIYMIIQDRHQNYWIGTQNGLYKISPDLTEVEVFQKELDNHHQLSANLIYCLMEDSDGLIWIATVSGLDVYNPLTKKITHFSKNENELSSELVISLCEDKKGKIWIGTSTYVNIYDKKDSTFTYLNKNHGLPNNNIFEIIKDCNDDLWLATGKGLCKYNAREQTFRTYTHEDGLQSLEFNLRGAHLCEDGEILIGGMNGFNTFYPDSVIDNRHVPNIEITSFTQSTNHEESRIPINDQTKIELNHKVNSFNIEFAALEYTNPVKNKFAYKMEGVSDQWIDLDNRKFVSFMALKPGEYIFRVKGSNNDGIWNEKGKSIRIAVLPPWWRSSLAYIIYFVLIALVIFTFINLRIQRLQHDKMILEQKVALRTKKIKSQNDLIISQNDELKSLNATKDKFFSIIGHDLGNQFHIIVGFSDILLKSFKKLPEEDIERQLSNIHSVSRHANNLLDNLLTWARLQTHSIKFNPILIDVTQQIFESIDMLEGANLKKNIDINVFSENEIELKADVNMFATIIRNIVNNSIKFTHENGSISIHVIQNNGFCEICIEDTGVGMPPEKIETLFKVDTNTSTQGTKGEKGTGLGLVLVKEFIEKHEGNIKVSSEVGKGSKFCITLPVEKN